MSEEHTRVEEPSLEDILTSIRKILSESEDEPRPDAVEANPDAELPGAAFDLEPAPPPRADAVPVSVPPDPRTDPDREAGTGDPDREALPDTDALLPPAQDLAAAVPEPDPGPESDAAMDDDVFELTEEMAVTEPHAHPEGNGDHERLISSDTEALAGGMIADLASQIAREKQIALGDGSLTLEALLRDILRELLRDWLDQNLPAMTERLVRKEIERLVERAEIS